MVFAISVEFFAKQKSKKKKAKKNKTNQTKTNKPKKTNEYVSQTMHTCKKSSHFHPTLQVQVRKCVR
eukprot:m.119923 g.119923  ORF g.119923 m.119923 type:complete len:67 (-) comp28774_c2_seq3:30-230(-)